MKLDFKKICEITFGAEEVITKDGKFEFFRFNKDEYEVYKKYKDEDFQMKTQACSNIRLSFITDSEKLKFKCEYHKGSSRTFSYFDIYEDGVLTNHVGTEDYKIGEIKEFEVALNKGEKHVEIYFPWSAKILIHSIEIDDGASIEPKKRSGEMVMYGDSVTQGYDAHYPSFSYANQLARLLDLDSINKAIGGERFFPTLVEQATKREPKVVTVSYGSNDWSGSEYDEFVSKCTKFMDNIVQTYKNSKIYVFTPIWRDDERREVRMGIKLEQIDSVIRDICKKYPQISVINGRKFVPHNTEFYEDKFLHPNDLGFSQHICNLYKALVTEQEKTKQ